MKRCSKCHELLPAADYHRNVRAADGLQDRCKSCRSASNREWRAKNPERVRHHNARRIEFVYGITRAQWEIMYEEQGGRCAACRAAFSEESPPNVDHCHESGQVRGLLCRKCNLALGYVGDRSEVLLQLVAYLEQT